MDVGTLNLLVLLISTSVCYVKSFDNKAGFLNRLAPTGIIFIANGIF